MKGEPGDTIVNHDRVKHRPEVMVVYDLNNLPWPWEDNSFDFIIACAVLEHLRLNLVESMNECWRILALGGRAHLKLPYWKHDAAYQDPTHYWQFTESSFDIFDPDTKFGLQYTFYTPYKWKIVKPAHLNQRGSSLIVLLEVRK
ncbi:MAG: methyltransferase domain-containing protein [Pseudomonadota bacterium]